MNCPQCGFPANPRDSFCAECGHSFASHMTIVHRTTPFPKRKRKLTRFDKFNIAFSLFTCFVIIGFILYLFM